jgi:hypothetical protein
MERRSGKRSSSAGSEKMERFGGAVAPTEEEDDLHARSLFIITHYDIRFIDRNSSVGSHLLVP